MKTFDQELVFVLLVQVAQRMVVSQKLEVGLSRVSVQ